MALAKFYEDIVNRLLEENETLRRQLWVETRTASPDPKHVDAHLAAANGVLNQLLEVLTSPDVATMFDEVAFARLNKEHEKLKAIEVELRWELNKRAEVIDSLNSENNKLNRKADKLSEDMKNMKRANRKKH